jgi:glycosyltransferase involved in cell wall biosynthesis
MPGLFAGAHLVVLPSYREGLPKVLVEAAACGRAVVTTDVAGCRDAIVAGETGVLVQPRDVRGLADAIARLLANPHDRQRMGQAGRRLAEREFAVERIVDEHMAVYRRLLGAST